MLTRRERLMRTLRGESVDRPAVSFYEIGGLRMDPEDPDPFNVYNSPDWRPLLELAEEHTDLIRLRSPVRTRSHELSAAIPNAAHREFFQTRSWEEDGSRYLRTTVNVAGRTLTETTLRRHDMDTVWTTEHLLKNTDDLRAYLLLPDEASAETIDVAPLIAEEAELGDRGIVMIDTEDPLCAAAALFAMEEYTIIALTEQHLFHQLLEKMARRIHARTQRVSQLMPGRLWRIYGPEYAAPPYLPPRLFAQYVVRYVRPMIDAIHQYGGFARIHSHGRLRDVLPYIESMEADALDPIEPPPQGDVELRFVRQQHGQQLVLFGNLEIADMENLPPEQFERKVQRALEEGTCGEGRGFVLMPSAAPCGRTISANTMQNYETIVRWACDR